jgi:carboxyl-terminal processing protease
MENRKINPYLPIYFSLVLVAGLLLGFLLSNRSTGLFSGGGKKDKLNEVLNYVESNYVDTISRSLLEEKSITGLLQSLDPHSAYISPIEFHEANDPLLGSFEGIGVQFRIESDTVAVIIPVSGGPSEKVGIRAGDRIIKVNGINIAGIKISTNDVMRKLKGPKGTDVTVSVFRRGVPGLTDYHITRDVIPTYSMDIAYMVKSGIGYIRLNNFSATTHEEIHNALKQLLDDGMKSLILDLRGNGGGYMQAAIDVSDEFLPKGTLIVYTEGEHHPREVYHSTADGLFEKGELVVLIDDFSASSSEIVAGAIQDNDRGTIVGRRSFGKGLVQEQLNFKDGSAVRLTVARYHTPTGRCIQRSYKDGTESYNNDYYHRFTNGELEHPDSIKFADSLKYRTPKGKIVYGGGGIMPDVYVPVERDSTLKFYNNLLNKGFIYQFAFDYTDRNRNVLNRFRNVDQFDRQFEISSSLFNEFLSYTEKKGAKRTAGDQARSDLHIRVMLKAYIGRNILDNEGFYPVLNKIDPTFLKGTEILEGKK